MALFDPITIRDTTFRNRLWVPPMNQWSVLTKDGVPSDWHLSYYGQLAAGGAALAIAESTAVSAEGRITPHDVGLYDDAQVAKWRRITDLMASCGCVAGVQLCHSGRKGSAYPGWGFDKDGTMPAEEGGWEIVAPSPLPFDASHATPRELTVAEIDGIVEDWAAAAVRAREAGFGVVELHAAHGYLIHQFLSPLTNHRADEYGGSLENRARVLTRITAAVRAAVPELALFVRFSATDWMPGGLTPEDVAQVAVWVRDLGVDALDVSTGGAVPGAKIPVGPGYQVEFAATLKKATGLPTAAVGMINEAEQAEEIVAEGTADAVMVGRLALGEPHLPLVWANELGAQAEDMWQPQYQRARLLTR